MRGFVTCKNGHYTGSDREQMFLPLFSETQVFLVMDAAILLSQNCTALRITTLAPLRQALLGRKLKQKIVSLNKRLTGKPELYCFEDYHPCTTETSISRQEAEKENSVIEQKADR